MHECLFPHDVVFGGGGEVWPESIERFIEGQASLRSYVLQSVISAGDSEKTELERQLADGRVGEGVGVEPNHTTGKQAWPSIIHSILSGSGRHTQ
jgi:hypothetical protein